MPINFPNNPSSGEIHTEGNKSWQWLGNRWGAYNVQNPEAFAFRNKVINGDMRIDQRNNGVANNLTANNYVTDQWAVGMTAASTFSIQRVNDAPVGFVNSARVSLLSTRSPAVGDVYCLVQRVEGQNMYDLAWGSSFAKSVTISFWVKASTAGVYSGRLSSSGAGIYSYVYTFTINNVNTWEYKTITIPGPTVGTWTTDNTIGIDFLFHLGTGSTRRTSSINQWVLGDFHGTTSGVNFVGLAPGSTFQITGVQLESGSTVTPFEHRPIGTELALCQRYFQLFSAYAIGAYPTLANAAASMTVNYPVAMRDTPIITTGTTTFVTNGGTPTFSWSLTNNRSVTLVVTQSGQTTAGRFGVQTVNNSAAAELLT